jgi:outer membrane protein OmpA-like peptidoglycan-associated protein
MKKFSKGSLVTLSAVALSLGSAIPAHADPVVFSLTSGVNGTYYLVHDHVTSSGSLNRGVTIDWTGTTCVRGETTSITSSQVQITFQAPDNGSCVIVANATKNGSAYGSYSSPVLEGRVVDPGTPALPTINITPLANNQISSPIGAGSQGLSQSNTCPVGSLINWSLTSAPSWVSINSSTGVASWTEAVPGTHVVAARVTCVDPVTNAVIATDDYEFQIVVSGELQTGTVKASVFFAGDSFRLTPTALRTIKALADKLPEGATGIKVTIFGYVHPTPDKSRDARLSANRAAVVKKQLALLGITAEYVVVGVPKPLAAKPTSRRSDIVVSYTYPVN